MVTGPRAVSGYITYQGEGSVSGFLSGRRWLSHLTQTTNLYTAIDLRHG